MTTYNNPFLALSSSPLMNLDHTKRYSGTKLVEEETLSQHITDTIMMGLKIVDEVNYLAGGEEKLLDVGLYLKKATYHDLEEAITGDVPRPLKYYNDDTLKSMRNVADEVALKFFSLEFRNSYTHYNCWDNAKSGNEGFILKLVDTLVVAHKVVKEVNLLHNFYMLRVAHEVIQYLAELKSKHFKFEIDAVDTYIDNLIQGAIDVMQKLLKDNQEIMRDLHITFQSMI